MTTRVLALSVMLMTSGCREILGIDDLTYDLGVGTACPAAVRAAQADGVIFWSTLDGPDAVETPRVGTGPGVLAGAIEFVPAQSGQGLLLDAAGKRASWPLGVAPDWNMLRRSGAVDLCLRPRVSESAPDAMVIFQGAGLWLEKNADGALMFSWEFEAVGRVAALPGNYFLEGKTWHRISTHWSFGDIPETSFVVLQVDGVEVPTVMEGAFPQVPENVDGELSLGVWDREASPGVVDELVIYDAPFNE